MASQYVLLTHTIHCFVPPTNQIARKSYFYTTHTYFATLQLFNRIHASLIREVIILFKD